MSYDADYENVYMVEFYSGKFIHAKCFNVEDVKEHCGDKYPNDSIKTIYEEVYFNDGEDEEA